MTTATLVTHGQTVDTETARPRRSLEELVDWLIETLFPTQTETAEPSVTRSIHEARRLRQAGDIDGGLAVLADVDVAKATTGEVSWAFSEWSDLLRRRFGDRAALVYTQGAGRAAVLVPGREGLLEVAAVLGIRWLPGKVVFEPQLAGPPAPGAGLWRFRFGGGFATAVAHSLTATPALKARCPLLPFHALPELGPVLA